MRILFILLFISTIVYSQDYNYARLYNIADSISYLRSLNPSNAKDYGAVGDGITDDYLSIQSALDSDKSIAIIGVALTDTFLVSQPLIIPSGKTVVLNGFIKIKDGVTKPLLANVITGTNTLTVTDADSYYSPGQWVSVSDDDQSTQGGGTGQTRKTSNTAEIYSVSGDTITLVDTLTSSFTTASNAFVGHTQSVLMLNGVRDVNIEGAGIIDANKDNQYDVQPVNDTSEETLAGCGITVYNSSNIKINGVKIQNAILHNLSLHNTDSVMVNRVQLYGAHDKNMLLENADNTTITGVRSSFADYEDGLVLHSASDNVVISDFQADSCGRFGLGVSTNNTGVVIDNYRSVDNGHGLYIASANTIASNIFVTGGGLYRHIATKETGVTVKVADNVTLINCNVDSVLSGNYNIAVLGSKNLKILGGSVRGTLSSVNSGAGIILSISTSYTTENLIISGVLFENLKSAIVNIASSAVKIIGCTFENNDSDGSARSSEFQMINCNGIEELNEITGTFVIQDTSGTKELQMSHDGTRAILYTTSGNLRLSNNIEIPTSKTISTYGTVNTVEVYNSSKGRMIFNTNYGSSSLGGYEFKAGGNLKYIITGGGTLGIGSTEPDTDVKLDVEGSAEVGVTSAQGVITHSPDGSRWMLKIANDGTVSADSTGLN